MYVGNRHNSNLNPFTITVHSDEVTEWPDGLSPRMGRLRAGSLRGGPLSDRLRRWAASSRLAASSRGL